MVVVAEHPCVESSVLGRSTNKVRTIEIIGPARARIATAMRPNDDAAWEDVRDRSFTVISITGDCQLPTTDCSRNEVAKKKTESGVE